MNIRRATLLVVVPLLAVAAAPSGDAPLYSNDFSKAAPGKLAEDENHMVLLGDFQVKEVGGGERFLELGPYPVDAFGMLFGPAGQTTGTASARVWAATTGRRFPEFGVGTNDTGGYKLWLMPRVKLLQIRKADVAVASAPYEGWTPETWTRFRLSVAKASDGGWRVQGKAWPDGTAEPGEWAVTFDDPAEPPAGRASVWANPYSGKPVRFDDLTVSR